MVKNIEIIEKELRKRDNGLIDKFLNIWDKANEIESKYDNIYIRIGVYYNNSINIRTLMNYLEIINPRDIYKCCINKEGFEELESKDRNIFVKFIEIDNSSRGECSNFILYPNDIDKKILNRVIEPRFYELHCIIGGEYDLNINKKEEIKRRNAMVAY